MTNATAFATFASSWTFSGETKLSIPSDLTSLTLALKTYIVSTALTSNNYQGFVTNWIEGVAEYDQEELPKAPLGSYFNGTLLWTLWCHTSQKCNSAPEDLSDDIVTKQWSVPELIFKGAWNCAAAGFWGQGLVNFAADGSLNMDCMSQMDQCVGLGQQPIPNCPTDLVNGGCPIQKCPGYN